MEHLFRKLEKYNRSGNYPYHMPGHKRRLSGSLPEQLMAWDITEIDGFDNLHQPEELIQNLQDHAARVYGSDYCYYLVNGSTCGILSAISAALPFGGKLLIARSSHKSVYHAAYLRHLELVYLHENLIDGFEIHEAVTPEAVEEALQKESEIQAVLIVSPTYEGRIADVRAIAEITHKYACPLIVDEAHGAHLGFAEGFVMNSNHAGADIVIHSVHKTLPALTQTALLHLNGKLVDRALLERFLHIYQSSSPSYLLMASIDNAISIIERDGQRRFNEFRLKFTEMLEILEKCSKLRFLTDVSSRQDIGKLVIDCSRTTISGKELYDILREEYGLQLEMACENYCLAMFTLADEEDAYRCMTEALMEIDSGRITDCLPQNQIVGDGVQSANAPCSMKLWEAWDLPKEFLALDKAIGRTVGDFVNLYPPGIPILVPGEVLTEEIYKRLSICLQQGLNVQGINENRILIINTNDVSKPAH